MGLAQLSTLSDCATFSSSHLEDCFSKNFDDSTKLTLMDAVRGAKWFNRSGASNSMLVVILMLVVIFNVGSDF